MTTLQSIKEIVDTEKKRLSDMLIQVVDTWERGTGFNIDDIYIDSEHGEECSFKVVLLELRVE